MPSSFAWMEMNSVGWKRPSRATSLREVRGESDR
jgi:hypothetical protein